MYDRIVLGMALFYGKLVVNEVHKVAAKPASSGSGLATDLTGWAIYSSKR